MTAQRTAAKRRRPVKPKPANGLIPDFAEAAAGQLEEVSAAPALSPYEQREVARVAAEAKRRTLQPMVHRIIYAKQVLSRINVPPVNFDLLEIQEIRDLVDILEAMASRHVSDEAVQTEEIVLADARAAAGKEAGAVRGRAERLAVKSPEHADKFRALGEGLATITEDLLRPLGKGEGTKATALLEQGLSAKQVVEELGLPPASLFTAAAGISIDFENVSEGDRERFDELVEKGAELPRGELGERRLLQQSREMAAEILRDDAAGPAKQRPRLERAGTVLVPPELFADLNEVTYEGEGAYAVRLPLDDVGYFVTVAHAIETKIVGPNAMLEGDTIVCRAGGRFWSSKWFCEPGKSFPPLNALSTHHPAVSLAKAGWLTVDRNAQTWRISYGPRYLKWLAAR